MRRLLILTLSLAAWASPVRAQEPAPEERARSLMATAQRRLAGGDTAMAFNELREAVELAPGLGEAQYLLGRLLTLSSTEVETKFTERLEAEVALRTALETDSDNPSYLAALGILFARQGRSNDAGRVLRRALRLAERQPMEDDGLLADVYYYLGRLAERTHSVARRARLTPPIREPLDARGRRPWLEQQFLTWDDPSVPVPEAGSASAERMAELYRAAIRHDPSHLEANQRLLLHLLETDQLDEYVSRAQRLVELRPDRPEPLLYLGLGLHADGREDEAGVAFKRGIAMLTEEERAHFMDLSPIMRRRAARAYGELDPSTRRRFEESYWSVSDPLYLTEANEQRLEHWARVVYADLRYSDPRTGTRGSRSESGIIFIRYGPAGLWAALRSIPPPLLRLYASYGGIDYVGEARHLQPADYSNISSISVLLPIPVQIARFRGARVGEVAVEIHAQIPLEGLARDIDLETIELETGLFLLTQSGRRLLALRDTSLLAPARAAARDPVRSWRVMLPAQPNLLAGVEVRDAVTWRAAAVRDTFSAIAFADDSLGISDILLARSIRPLAPEPRRRADLDIGPNPGLPLVGNENLGLYYEIYGLRPDDDGFASFDVAISVTVKSLDRAGTVLDAGPLKILAQIADAWGFSAVGDDRVELRFSRLIDVRRADRVVEYQLIDLNAAPSGEYEIRIQVWDRLAERLVDTVRRFTIATMG